MIVRRGGGCFSMTSDLYIYFKPPPHFHNPKQRSNTYGYKPAGYWDGRGPCTSCGFGSFTVAKYQCMARKSVCEMIEEPRIKHDGLNGETNKDNLVTAVKGTSKPFKGPPKIRRPRKQPSREKKPSGLLTMEQVVCNSSVPTSTDATLQTNGHL